MKVNFTRKPTVEEFYPQTEVVIEKVIRLTPDEFKEFISEPLDDREFVKKNVCLMGVDEGGYWHCIFVIAEGYDYGVLIQSEGYDYPRYSSFLPVELFKL